MNNASDMASAAPAAAHSAPAATSIAARRLACLAEARRRAQALDAPLLLRVLAELPHADYAAAALPRAAASSRAFIFDDRPAGLTVAALGSVVSAAFKGATRFASAQSFCSNAAKQTLELDWGAAERLAVTAPFVVGGFAFAPTSERREPWAAWPDAEWWVPEQVFVSENGRWRVELWLQVRGEDSADALALSVERRLAAAAASPAPTPRQAETEDVGPPVLVPDEPRGTWMARVAGATAAVKRGDLTKVVLARAARLDSASGVSVDAAASWLRLRSAHPGAISFLLVRDGSLFLGATPEVLLRTASGTVETHALAGTAARRLATSATSEASPALLESNKDLGEHAVVARTLRAALEPCCIELNEPAAPRVLALTNVEHLETTLRGRLRPGTHPFDVAQRLHPSASLGGHPADAALAYLAAHEPLERGWYTGAIGWVRGADATLAVAIRSALVADGAVWAYAGAGVVEDSDPASEWSETELKLETVRSALLQRREEP